MRLKENLSIRYIGNEFMLIASDQQMVNMTKVCTLSESAAMIWEEFSAVDFNEADVVLFLQDNYVISNELVHEDVKHLLNQFRKEGLLQN
ncbi:PqqD family protein [Sphingobacterium sp. HJSM2_6]|uniref:PqqD family protein n=1 Tax=Sphingobacterium sp. HJSM2_6 TaxID=3366264 RepID=UPI003BC9F85C